MRRVTNDPGMLPGSARRWLAAESERADDGPIARGVLLDEVREQAPALTHELEEAAARMVVLREAAEVLVEVSDPLGEERDLDLRRTGVAVFDGVLGNNLLLLFPRERHSILRHERWRADMCLLLRPAEDSRRRVDRTNPSGGPMARAWVRR